MTVEGAGGNVTTVLADRNERAAMEEAERAPTIDHPSVEAIAREVREMLQTEGNARALFGAPLKLDSRTVIPVAMIEVGAGGGSGFGHGAARGPLRALLGWAKTLVRGGGGGRGGGLAVRVRPVGYLYEEGKRIVFAPIDIR
jgi:uncharacterized spore protein YtfJ